MIELIRISDPLSLQIVCDAFAEKGIAFRVDNAGMNALMPLPVVMDARIRVESCDLAAARQILADLEISR